MHSQPRVVISVLLVCILFNRVLSGETLILDHAAVKPKQLVPTTVGLQGVEEVMLKPVQTRSSPNNFDIQTYPLNLNNHLDVKADPLSSRKMMTNTLNSLAANNPSVNSDHNVHGVDNLNPVYDSIRSSIDNHLHNTQKVGVNNYNVNDHQGSNSVNSASIPNVDSGKSASNPDFNRVSTPNAARIKSASNADYNSGSIPSRKSASNADVNGASNVNVGNVKSASNVDFNGASIHNFGSSKDVSNAGFNSASIHNFDHVNVAATPNAGSELPSRKLSNGNTLPVANQRNSRPTSDSHPPVALSGMDNSNANVLTNGYSNGVVMNAVNPNVGSSTLFKPLKPNNIRARKRHRRPQMYLHNLDGLDSNQQIVPEYQEFRHPHHHHQYRRHHHSPFSRGMRKRRLHSRVSPPYECRGAKKVGLLQDVDEEDRTRARCKHLEEKHALYENKAVDENRRARALAKGVVVPSAVCTPAHSKGVLEQEGLNQPSENEQSATKSKISLNEAMSENNQEAPETAKLAEHYLPYIPQILMPSWDHHDAQDRGLESNQGLMKSGQELAQDILQAQIDGSETVDETADEINQDETEAKGGQRLSIAREAEIGQRNIKVEKGSSQNSFSEDTNHNQGVSTKQRGTENVDNNKYSSSDELDKYQASVPSYSWQEPLIKDLLSGPRNELVQSSVLSPQSSKGVSSENQNGQTSCARRTEIEPDIKRSLESANKLAHLSATRLENKEIPNERTRNSERVQDMGPLGMCNFTAKKRDHSSIKPWQNNELLNEQENKELAQVDQQRQRLNLQGRNMMNRVLFTPNNDQVSPENTGSENLIKPVVINHPVGKRSNHLQLNYRQVRSSNRRPMSRHAGDYVDTERKVGREARHHASPNYYRHPRRRVLRDKNTSELHKLTRAQKKARLLELADELYNERDAKLANKRTAASVPVAAVTKMPAEKPTVSPCKPGEENDEEGQCVKKAKEKMTKCERIAAMLAKAECRKQQLQAETSEKNISSHHPYEVLGVKDDDSDEGLVTTTTKKPVNETAVYLNIIKDLEEIKEGHDQPDLNGTEGFPCHLDGVWISEVAGVRFTIDSKPTPMKVRVAERKTPLDYKLLSTEWDVTGSAPYKHDGLFHLLAIQRAKKKIAMFTGQCMRCYGDDMVVGKWVFGRTPKNCRDAHLAEFQRKDVFRRPKKSSRSKKPT